MKKIIEIVFFLFLNTFLFAQTATGDIELYFSTIIDNAPGNSGDNYTEPNTSQLNTWNTTIDYILSDDLINARSSANGFNYQITEFTDTSISPNQIFYILEEKNPQSNYWGTYAFSKTPTRNNLIILAPHSKYDTNTGKQAVYCFKNTVAKALFINGTHRCNSSSFSPCSGTTGVCGNTNSYRLSDLAHTTTSIFQKTTKNLFNSISNSVFIQLHGFGKRSTDPYVILSNGTRVTPTIDYATLLKSALLVEDSSLTFKIAHINTDWNRLIGFTNTQGRLINNSTDFCNASATSTSGRFIHIEQEKSKLRSNQTGWNKMSNALASVFSSTLDVGDYNTNFQVSVFPNPTDGTFIISGANIKQLEIYNSLGKQILFLDNYDIKTTINIDLKKYPKGLYFLSIISDKNMIAKKLIKQ